MSGAIREDELLTRYRQARLSRDQRFDGQFFVAVKSTGIFCRPICPARLPKEENVDYYHYAAQAMHAGFRPCLRCRPDSAPQSPAWNGVATTVNRAAQLLAALPPQPIADIADRLGITSRYLHKLMQQHMGSSPSQWQKYHQLLFAKQLHGFLPDDLPSCPPSFQDLEWYNLRLKRQRILPKHATYHLRFG